MAKQEKFKGTYKGEFSRKYWIPVYGAVRAALNFGKAESAFHDTPDSYPTSKRILRAGTQLTWLGYQAVTSFATLVASLRGYDALKTGIEKLF